MRQTDSDFELCRAHLERLAYRMLGSRADADDMLQEAYLRWTRAPRDQVLNNRAFLSSIVTRLCIDRRREIERRKESYVGPWLPEPFVEPEPTPDRAVEAAESVSLALMHLLERLSPVERAAYLLRQIFDFDYAEIGKILDKSEANCRQIVSRCNTRLHADRPRFEPGIDEVARVNGQFLQACATGDYDGLVRLLADEVVMVSDGGGKAAAALRPVVGADKVARFFLGVYRKSAGDARVEHVLVNGQPGLATYSGAVLTTVLSFDVGDGQIRACYLIRNPDKLARSAEADHRPISSRPPAGL